MNYKRKEFWIPTVIGLIILSIVAGIMIYRQFFRPEEWRLYEQIRTKHKWAEWVFVQILGEKQRKKIKDDAYQKLVRMKQKAIPPLIALLNDDDYDVLKGAAFALGNIGDKSAAIPLIERSMEEMDIFLSDAFADALYRIMFRKHESIEAGIQKSTRSLYSLSGYANFDTPMLPIIIKCMQDQNIEIKVTAAKYLGEFGFRRDDEYNVSKFVTPLNQCLNDDNEIVRKAAAEALKKLGHPVTSTNSKP